MRIWIRCLTVPINGCSLHLNCPRCTLAKKFTFALRLNLNRWSGGIYGGTGSSVEKVVWVEMGGCFTTGGGNTTSIWPGSGIRLGGGFRIGGGVDQMNAGVCSCGGIRIDGSCTFFCAIITAASSFHKILSSPKGIRADGVCSLFTCVTLLETVGAEDIDGSGVGVGCVSINSFSPGYFFNRLKCK